MTYIGDIKELNGILNELSHFSGFERLKAEIKSSDWEQFESAFAVAIEAHHFHIKKIPLEFEPEVILRMNEVEKSLNKIFTSDKYNRISSAIADIQLATGKKKRKLFINPNTIISLTKDEIDCLDL